MLKNLSRKIMSGFLAASMVVTLMPATPAQAATASISGKTAAVSGTSYNYTVKNVTSSQYIKVKLSGTATSAVATVNKKTVKNGKTSAFVKGTGKDLTVKVAAKNAGKSYKLTVKVYKKNKKTVVKTLTTTAKVYSHSISKITGSTTVEVGKKVTLKAVKKYSQSKKAVTWASSKTSVATVGKTTGVVTGKKAGTATITATCGTSKKTVKVTVKAKAEEEKPEEPTDKPDDTVSGDKPATSGDTVSGDKPATSGDSVSGDKPAASGDTVTTNKLEMTSLVAAKANQLVAKFAAPVSGDKTISVSRKGATTAVAGVAVWNADNTEVTFTTDTNLFSDTYTMTVTVGTENTSKSVEVMQQQATEIVIESKEALTNADKTEAYVYYKVYDQYHQDLTESTSVTVKTSASKEDNDRTTGRITLHAASGDTFTYGNPLSVTIVYAKGGISLSKTALLTVGMEQSLDSIEFAGFVCEDDTTKILKTLPAKFQKDKYYLIYNALDQEGHVMEATGLRIGANPENGNKKQMTVNSLSPLTIESIFDEEKMFTVAGKTYDAFLLTPGMYVDKGGDVILNVISNSTGKTTPVTVSVGKSGILESLSLEAPTKIVADGESCGLNYTALDTNGNKVTSYETIVRSINELSLAVNDGILSISQSDTGAAVFRWNDGLTNTCDNVDRMISITTVVIGGKSNAMSFEVKDTAYPVAIKSIKTKSDTTVYVPTEVTSNTVDVIDFSDDDLVTYVDCYSRDMLASRATGWIKLNNNPEMHRDLKVSKLDGKDYAIKITKNGNDDNFNVFGGSKAVEVSSNTWTVSLNVLKAVTMNEKVEQTLTFTIAEKDGSDLNNIGSKKDLTLTIVPISDVKSIEIKDISKQQLASSYSSYANLSEAGVSSHGAKVTPISANVVNPAEIKVVGKYNGQTVNIPTDYYEVVTSNEAKTVSASGNKLSAISGNYDLLYDTNSASLVRKDVTGLLTLDLYSVSANQGIVSANATKLTKKVTFSDALSTPSSIKFVDRDGKGYTDVIFHAANTAKSYTVTSNNVEGNYRVDNAVPNAIEKKRDIGASYFVGVSSNGRCVYAKVFDQYGNNVTNKDDVQKDLSLKIDSIVESNTEFTHDVKNGFTIAKNGTNKPALSYIEIGDTYKLNVSAGNVSATLNVTVGSDDYAWISNSYTGDDDILRGTLNIAKNK